MNFRQLDLNLLRVLAAIHRTGSVTAAGKALSLSQLATSSALARLRRHLNDELFVRTPDGLKSTRACERLAPEVTDLLHRLESTMSAREAFDPAHSEARWRTSLSDLGEMMFLPALATALRTHAPHARLANVAVAAEDLPGALEAREIDFAIGILNPRQRGIRTELLFCEHYVAMSSAHWRPASGRVTARLTPDQLSQASIVVASPTATFHGSVEKTLVRLKLSDRIVLRARHFGALPDLALNTDLLTIVPQMYAEILSQRLDMRVWELPEGTSPDYEVRLVWHSSTANDPAQVWIREQVHRLFRR
ncbi:MAG: LysR family transcriptional regulator [Hydrogenophaga sp.]|uniref:LysR family transcriptional regulator n=1 Tax=Hydrogenophaga sp. TaxID=1904254 RepID=UPI001D743C8C|nr:LysR family transcriptional regulator [Hydrogenophaga sp.]MBX3608713.1 LysR family transcriptional regulator [Hydrogenophaga sp.]